MIWLRRILIALAAIAAVSLALSGPVTRYLALPYQVGLLLFLVAGVAGLLAAIAALVAFCIPRVRRTEAVALLAALVVGTGSALAPLGFLGQARAVPPINDISTDLQNAAFAEQQKKAYPDLGPLKLAASPGAAFGKARAAAQAMGWEIVAADATTGRIAAVDTSQWFGFKDDVEVRISPEGMGSRIDVRSKSRVGRSDAGANARRIQDYLQRLK